MVELAEIVRNHGAAYVAKYGNKMLPSHKRALAAILSCRTEELGGHLYKCDDCDCAHHRYSYHSCKHPSCPKCHTADTKRWLDKRRSELLPVPYFHATATLPQGLRRIVRSNQRTLYPILMRTAAEALLTLGLDPKYVGGQLGILSVLHTWSRILDFHPHVHMLVPAGGVDKDGVFQPVKNRKYLVCEKAFSRIFRGKFMAAAKKALPKEKFPEELWKVDWVVKIKPPVRNPEKVLDYLGRYVHRIAISNSRIISLKDGMVTFRYQKSDTREWKTTSMPALEFLRKFLQHVLPDRFHKVRYFGLWSPGNKKRLRKIRQELREKKGIPDEPKEEAVSLPAAPDVLCPCCRKGRLVIVETLPKKARSPPWQGKWKTEVQG